MLQKRGFFFPLESFDLTLRTEILTIWELIKDTIFSIYYIIVLLILKFTLKFKSKTLKFKVT